MGILDEPTELEKQRYTLFLSKARDYHINLAKTNYQAYLIKTDDLPKRNLRVLHQCMAIRKWETLCKLTLQAHFVGAINKNPVFNEFEIPYIEYDDMVLSSKTLEERLIEKHRMTVYNILSNVYMLYAPFHDFPNDRKAYFEKLYWACFEAEPREGEMLREFLVAGSNSFFYYHDTDEVTEDMLLSQGYTDKEVERFNKFLPDVYNWYYYHG